MKAEKLNMGRCFQTHALVYQTIETMQEFPVAPFHKLGVGYQIMRTSLAISIFVSCCVTMALSQKRAPLSQEALTEITARGRMLAEYDQAAWHATDAVMATHPKQDSDSRFVCQKADKSWTSFSATWARTNS
jgi:hypothetical protein